jgi:hypothetical protein
MQKRRFRLLRDFHNLTLASKTRKYLDETVQEDIARNQGIADGAVSPKSSTCCKNRCHVVDRLSQEM